MDKEEQINNIDKNIQTLTDKMKVEPIREFLKMKLVELKSGYAKVTMPLLPEYKNFNGFVFGGIIASVADQAFAYASNSVAYPSVATQFNIHFIAGASIGDVLTAECQLITSGRRVGIYEMTVTNQHDKLIARATGTTIPISTNK
jgi:acyl-CoA thioesterase